MRLIRSAMCALYPPAAGLPGVADTDIDGFLARYRSETNLITWVGVVLGTAVFTLSPVLTLGIPLPTFMLSDKQLATHARRIPSSPIYLVRQAITLVKMCAGLCWGSHPTVRAHMNLPPYGVDPGTWRTT